jgi:hypothetical protein
VEYDIVGDWEKGRLNKVESRRSVEGSPLEEREEQKGKKRYGES